jgi:hypothetical protein
MRTRLRHIQRISRQEPQGAGGRDKIARQFFEAEKVLRSLLDRCWDLKRN